jgi:MYXO-CTERM domain-containing protein
LRSRLFVCVAIAGLAISWRAEASTGYPEALEKDLGLAKAPGCDLCHHAASDPVGPADTAFAKSMIARGLVAKDATSIATAITKMRADGVDSDGDGAQDLDELSWGGDPNHADLPPEGRQEPVSYGCSASSEAPAAWAALLAVALVAAARRRSRRG